MSYNKIMMNILVIDLLSNKNDENKLKEIILKNNINGIYFNWMLEFINSEKDIVNNIKIEEYLRKSVMEIENYFMDRCYDLMEELFNNKDFKYEEFLVSKGEFYKWFDESVIEIFNSVLKFDDYEWDDFDDFWGDNKSLIDNLLYDYNLSWNIIMGNDKLDRMMYKKIGKIGDIEFLKIWSENELGLNLNIDINLLN
jgi:hypothetical protein